MDYQSKKKTLESYRDLRDKLTYLNNRIINVKSISYEQKAGGIGKSCNELIDEKNEIERQMNRITNAIEQVEDTKQSLVLWYRYVDCCTVEKTAKLMNYEVAQVYRYQKSAIKALKVIVDDRV